MAKSYLVLEDGSVFEGEPFGYKAPAAGEIVFSTGMSGYQESLTDPSNKGNILIMTYPLIGNYEICNDSFLSDKVHVSGIVVREYCREPSPMYGGHTLDDLLIKNKVPGISGIDTRELTIKIRTAGTLKGMITEDLNRTEDLIRELRKMPFPSENNLVADVSSRNIEEHSFGKDVCVGLLDLGDKDRLLKDMSQRFNVVVFPYGTPADVITGYKVRGIVVSDGPGDPSHPELLKTTARTISDLSVQMPVFGICLGGQTAAAAMGCKTYKMRFGHRGSNQPVKFGGKVFITSQNHGFAVDSKGLEGKDLIADQTNVNDGTVEGIRHNDLPLFTSQYYPEASPGPWDTSFLFDRFAKIAGEGRL